MFSWLGDVTVTRKFVDMVYHLTGRYLNVDPCAAEMVKLGDYGNLDPETGAWVAEGNIFVDMPDISKDVKTEEGNPNNIFRMSSDNAKITGGDHGVDADLRGVVGVNAAVTYDFTGDRGALVWAIQMKSRYFAPSDIRALMKDDRLRKHRLVTQIWEAPAYVTYMSSKGGSSITVSLAANVPIPAAPGVASGASLGIKWMNKYSGGVYQDGCEPQKIYTPFFKVVKKRGIFRESPLPEGVEPIIYEDAEPPWGDLDEDGEEIMPEDF